MGIHFRTTAALTAGLLFGAVGVMFFRPAVLPVAAGSGVQGISPTEGALLRPIPEVLIDSLPLDEAVAKLSQLGGVPITCDRQRLEGAKLPVEGKLTLRLRGESLV